MHNNDLFLLFVQNLKGHRLNTTVIKYVYAHTGVGCVLLCLSEDTSCRSTNFRKTSNSDKNCELLRDIHSEKTDLLLKDVQFDHYQLLDPNRKPPEPVSTSTPPEITQKPSSTIMSHTSCSNASWRESFKSSGWSKCGKDNLFITGFYRNHPYSDSDPITLLEETRCCSSIQEFSEQNGNCRTANWWKSLDFNNRWSLCPSGYFLNGLYRNKGQFLHSIEEGYCCRPNNHPDRYGLCYDEDVGVSFDREGWSNCSKPEYYITGVYRGSGENWLNNVDKFRCCQMV
ncbi:Hypothetical predicted protein [Paramuricea clavata]|uniref:Apple domain-containing protein n=1 Tax=Paramuricea clavata TaxID=317549 RepID=A0A6S7K7V3_PARCT|nr:Hypothetical predicted protein [Paramuricea clavata]